MAKRIIIFLSLFTLIIRVDSQFYDLFQSFQPHLNTQTTKPDYNFFNFGHKPKTDRNEDQIDRQRPISGISDDRQKDRTTTSKPKRKTTQSQFFGIDFTTAKAIKKNSKNPSSQRTESSNRNRDQALVSTNRRQLYDDSSNSVDYTERTTRRNFATTKKNVVTQRPYSATTKDYYNSNHNGFTLRPGVKPAPVDTNRPPITNRPPTSRPYAVYPIATDSSAIRYPEEPDTSPEVLAGPDEDSMSSVERRRFESLAEKMCDKYKSFSIQKVEAIPLLPSPEPVRVNVSVCSPTTIPLVVGGKPVSVQEFPHMALLGWTKKQESGYSWKCGGSLISDQFVLTAGHCASQEKDDTVVTGAPRVVQLGSSYMDDTGALVVKVLTVYRHPKYLRPKSYYDIALVKLVKPVTFSEVVRPACLGQPPGVGQPVIVTGWGKTEYGGSLSTQLRSVSVPIWDMEECRQVLGVSRKMPDGPSRDSQVCAGEKRGGKDTCQGDSGGPAQIQDGCVWRVVAVTSIGRSCGAMNTPALYATVHKAFIAATIYGKATTNQQTDRNTNNKPNINHPNRNNNNNKDAIVNTNQSAWNSNQPNRNNNNNRQDSVVNNNQGAWNSNQANTNNNNNRQVSTTHKYQGTFNSNSNNNNNNGNNNNQGSWNSNSQTNNNNQGAWSNAPNTNSFNNNQNSWNEPNINNGNRNGAYQSSNINNNKRQNNNNNNNSKYQAVTNPSTYYNEQYNAQTESTVGNGNNRRDYNYNNNNRDDYDDYFDNNREHRSNNFRNFVTTKRPSYSWPNFGF